MKQKTTKVFVLIAAIQIWQSALAQETVWYQSDYCKPKMVCGHEGHFVISQANNYWGVKTGNITVIQKSFDGCKIKSVVVPKTITTITNSFISCKNLESVSLPDNLKELDWCFNYCSDLFKITLPPNLKLLRKSFHGCTSLSSVTIPKSVEKLTGCFEQTALKNVIFEGFIKEIYSCFNRCYALEQIKIPDGAEIINNSFNKCDALQSITISSSVRLIHDSFMDETNPKEIKILSSTPPLLEFSGYYEREIIFQQCTLYVPRGSLNAYKTADGWKHFSTIKELE